MFIKVNQELKWDPCNEIQQELTFQVSYGNLSQIFASLSLALWNKISQKVHDNWNSEYYEKENIHNPQILVYGQVTVQDTESSHISVYVTWENATYNLYEVPQEAEIRVLIQNYQLPNVNLI